MTFEGSQVESRWKVKSTEPRRFRERINARFMSTAITPAGMVEITIDGTSCARAGGHECVRCGTHEWGSAIPTLCHLQNETPVGVCRLCVVDTGARVLTASCVRPVEPGMKVVTNSEKVLARERHCLNC